MDREIVKKINNWCEAQNIDHTISSKSECLFVLVDEKVFLFLDERDQYFNEELSLNLTTLEKRNLTENVCGLLFFFGGLLFQTKFSYENFIETKKVQVEFNQFTNIGKPKLLLNLSWTHLGVHTEYELNNGNQKAQDWVDKAKFLGLKSLGVCDFQTLAGTLAFQLACEKNLIKPILGMSVNVYFKNEVYKLYLYCNDKTGWGNLLNINKLIHVDVQELDIDFIEYHSSGLTIVISCHGSFGKRFDEFCVRINSLSSFVFYQVDTASFVSDDADLNLLNNIKYLMGNKDLRPVLLNDSYYIERHQHDLKKLVNQADKRADLESHDQHFKTLDESYAALKPLFVDQEQFISFFSEIARNTIYIENAVNFKIDLGRHKLPKYEVVSLSECGGDKKLRLKREREFFKNKNLEQGDVEGLFFLLIQQGWSKKLSSLSEQKVELYLQRLESEIEVIVPAGFIDYFLILWDVVRWCKEERGIMVGSGRGSVVGSLIAYLLDITTVDPVKFDLLFERFLNKTRVSGERAQQADALPDVDLDFESAYRTDVKRYFEFKYGKEHVCTIGAYGRMKVKSGLKDFARVKGVSFQEANHITSFMDEQLEWTWGDIFKYATQSKVVYDWVQKYPDIVVNLLFALNQATNSTVHASAIIITPKTDHEGNPMTIFDWLPVKKMLGQDGQEILVSQWEGKYTDRGGYLKEDILGLDQLDKFKKILSTISQNSGDVILEEIPFDDSKVFKAFSKGWVEDVFQFGSDGLRNYSRKTKPQNIEHLIVMNALYRPGPMSSNAHTEFAEILNGERRPTYDFKLRSVTEPTLGLYVYQEQIMKAVVVLGGLSLVESDNFRTAIKKFDKSKMVVYEQKFVAGAIERGCEEDIAKEIWLKLLRFSGYGFNKSHSAAYTIMSYWSMWLKVHYPLEFWTTSLQFSKDTQITYRIFEMGKVNPEIKIVPPDINLSTDEFVCNENKIYWSLKKIKGIADSSYNKIVSERQNGLYESVEDFLQRMKGKGIGESLAATLVLSGCFDSVGQIDEPKDRIKLIKRVYKKLPEKFTGEFLSDYFFILEQKNLCGLGDIDFVSLINKVNKNMATKYIDSTQFSNAREGAEVVVAGEVDDIRERNSKNGKFAQVRLLNNNGFIDMTLWPEFWSNYSDQVENAKEQNKLIAIQGQVKTDSYRNQKMLYSTQKSRPICL